MPMVLLMLDILHLYLELSWWRIHKHKHRNADPPSMGWSFSQIVALTRQGIHATYSTPCGRYTQHRASTRLLSSSDSLLVSTLFPS